MSSHNAMGGDPGTGYAAASAAAAGSNGALVTGGGVGRAGSVADGTTASAASRVESKGALVTGGGSSSYAARSAAAHGAASSVVPPPSSTVGAASSSAGGGGGGGSHKHHHHAESPAFLAEQNRLLTDSTRRVQEHAYYMRQAMDKDDLSTALDRAAHMLGELGDPNHHHHHHHHHAHPTHQPGMPPSTSSSQYPHATAHHHRGPGPTLTPKNYYELHMRALDEMPNLEEYMLTLTHPPAGPGSGGMVSLPGQRRHTMKGLYEAVQYCPRVVPRLYLQICAGSALVRSGEVGAKSVLSDLIDAVKCVQCPLRGLFLRHYLLQAMRDKLPDAPPPRPASATTSGGEGGETRGSATFLDDNLLGEGFETSVVAPSAPPPPPAASTASKAPAEPSTTDEKDGGTVEDAQTFVLSNFIEMNKLWVRIQHMPGDAKSKEQRKRRERERNELRILVGSNLVRLTQLEGVTSKAYGEVILPKILDQIVACRDALAQAYLTDCIIQVFPDEFHIETLSIFLGVLPKLREKVNIRTIVQSLMDRLSNYYADELLLDETDSNQVKRSVAMDSFELFEECVRSVYKARASMPPREVVRLQTSLLNFSLKCDPGNTQNIDRCLGVCAASLRGADGEGGNGGGGGGATNAGGGGGTMVALPPAPGSKPPKALDGPAVDDLEKLLSIPLESLALRVLDLDHYSELLTFLPWENRRQVAVVLLKAVETSGCALTDVRQIEELFRIVAPLIRDEGGGGPAATAMEEGPAASASRTADLMGELGISSDSTVPTMAGGGGNGGTPSSSFHESDRSGTFREEQNLVAKLVHLLHHDDTDVLYEMLAVARRHLGAGGKHRFACTLVPVAFSGLRLLRKVFDLEYLPRTPDSDLVGKDEVDLVGKEDKVVEKEVQEKGEESSGDDKKGDAAAAGGEDAKEDREPDLVGKEEVEKKVQEEDSSAEKKEEAGEVEGGLFGDSAPTTFSKSVNCRKIFVFLQQTVAMIASSSPELGLKLYLQIASAADGMAVLVRDRRRAESAGVGSDFSSISYDLLCQACLLYEDEMSDSKAQHRSIVSMVGTLLSVRTFEKGDYEALITKTAQYGAKLLKKPDQCKMVTLCSHLFFTGEKGDATAYRNPQRVLECLQRALKIADACSMASPSNVYLFVDILDRYVYYFERENPVITDKFVSGLVALINEHMENIGAMAAVDSSTVADAQAQYRQILRHIKKKKADTETAGRFGPVVC